jgi:hypothetical protein
MYAVAAAVAAAMVIVHVYNLNRSDVKRGEENERSETFVNVLELICVL